MPYYSYRGRNARGELVKGVLENSDSGAVADQLMNIGVSPIEISVSAAPKQGAADSSLKRLFQDRVQLDEMLLFSRQMYTLLKSGVPILRALAGLQESSTSARFTSVLQDVRSSLDSGRELSAAMARHSDVFSRFYLSMVRVGEMTGALEEIFLRLFHHMEFEKEMKQRVKQALRYPIFVVIAMVVALVVVNLFVIPEFAKLYTSFKSELPFFTRLLIGTSNFTVRYWPVFFAASVGAWIAFRAWVATPAGRYAFDRAKLRIPIAGKIVERATMARFARSFSIAFKSGIPVVQALTVTAQVVENAYIAQRIEQMRDGVERGESVLRTASAAGVFTPVVLQMLSVGEETGELDRLMLDVAELYEREVDYDLKTLSSQIEPILIVGLAVLVLVLALGVFLPIWDLSQVAFKRG